MPLTECDRRKLHIKGSINICCSHHIEELESVSQVTSAPEYPLVLYYDSVVNRCNLFGKLRKFFIFIFFSKKKNSTFYRNVDKAKNI